MSPESQELESFFQKIDAAEAPFRDGLASDPTTENFDDFFERLSSIDDLVLGEDSPEGRPIPTANASSTQKRSRVPKKSAAAPRAKSSGGKMRIFRSDSPGDEIFGGATTRDSSAWMKVNRTRRRSAAACKIAAAAVLLFGVGLSSGWAALSLPEKFGDRIATFTNRFQATKNLMEKAPSRVEFAVAKARQPELPTNADVKPIVTTLAERGESKAGLNHKVAALELPAAEMFDDKKDSKNQAAPAKRKGPSPQGRFAIQVGACYSPKCVNSYRKLLLPHVTPEAIQVFESKTLVGQEPVQRIRVVALTEADARRLKKNLAAADARLKDAYLVAVSKAPSS